MAAVEDPEPRRCSSCGEWIESEVFEAQRDNGGYTEGADCRDCLEGVKTNPQLEQLYEQVSESLDPDQREKWDEGTAENKLVFALHLINEDVVNGGSPGLHEQLRKYACLWAHDHDEREGE